MGETIFDKIKSKISFSLELQRLETLLKDPHGIMISEKPDPLSFQLNKKEKIEYYPIERYIDQTYFKQWQNRGTCISCDDMRNTLDIPNILSKDDPSNEDIRIYTEYVANIVCLQDKVKLNENYNAHRTDISLAILKNLESLLSWLNLELVYFDKKEKVLIHEKYSTVSAVSEITNEEITYQIVEYNHHTLKGNMEKKKAILLSLANELEPKRKKLSSINNQLTTNIFFMLNNLNLRHNNKSKRDKNYKEFVAKMPKEKLESW